MCQLRGIKAVFQSAAKDKGADMLSDEECIAVLRKLAKQVTQPAYSVYLLYWYVLYWYKSTVHSRPPQAGERDSSLYLLCWDKSRVHTCHAQAGDTGTQPAYSVYLLYWYKRGAHRMLRKLAKQVLSLLALLVQEYKY
jgi:hypothetical protein